VWENVIAGLIALAIVAVCGWALSNVDASIALWAVFVVAALAASVGAIFGWAVHDRSDLPAYQADLLGEAMLALRDYAAGRLDVSFDDLIERGILAPARFGMSFVAGEKIRLSILELDDSGEAFRMLYESGHGLGRKENFSLPRTSLAGHAFDAKELKWTDNVNDDARWQPHPLADQKRRYKSLAVARRRDFTCLGHPHCRRSLLYRQRCRICGRGKLMAHGSIPMGPSELYLQLLKGEITPEAYAKQAKKRIQSEANERPRGKRTATQGQRASAR
jgi:hypothetical protein